MLYKKHHRGDIVKKFVFLFIGFTQPTPEIMQAWMQWIKSVEDKIADMGNGLGREEK